MGLFDYPSKAFGISPDNSQEHDAKTLPLWVVALPIVIIISTFLGWAAYSWLARPRAGGLSASLMEYSLFGMAVWTIIALSISLVFARLRKSCPKLEPFIPIHVCVGFLPLAVGVLLGLATQRSERARREAQTGSLNAAIEAYFTDHTRYPSCLSDLVPGYIDQQPPFLYERLRLHDSYRLMYYSANGPRIWHSRQRTWTSV